jgi:hypothetical protein
MQAKGKFDVKVTPETATPLETEAKLARYGLQKSFHGDLQGEARGEMLSTLVEDTKAMGYVALDRFSGELAGHKGSFLLMHQATMTNGDPSSGVMKIVVMKGSGTGDLKGISGELTIIIDANGNHSYIFDYQLP